MSSNTKPIMEKIIAERDDKEKAEVIEDLQKQIQIEGKLVVMYETREKESKT